jgi:hypothetical protein
MHLPLNFISSLAAGPFLQDSAELAVAVADEVIKSPFDDRSGIRLFY